jgi:putative addiction module component (TIGR02574 family)
LPAPVLLLTNFCFLLVSPNDLGKFIEMNATTEQVFIEALTLPARERAVLVQRLLASLQSEAGSAEVEAAWKQEVIDRGRAFDEAQLTERDAQDVLRDAYGKLQ